jgi:hypothetical protein
VSSWEALKDAAKSRYRLAEDYDRAFKVVFKHADGRLQAVIVSHYEAMGHHWVDLSSACCRIEQLEPQDALMHGFNLAVGALCLDGEVYVVRHTVLLEDLSLDSLLIHVHAVARAADQIGRSVARGAVTVTNDAVLDEFAG